MSKVSLAKTVTSDRAWEDHWRSEGRRHVHFVHKVMLFGWEGYTKNGNGFNNEINTFETVSQALSFIGSPYIAQADLGTLQLIDMTKLTVIARFERQNKTDKWSRVA